MTSKDSDPDALQFGPKSCDQCRRRKIRCDRKSPCSSCTAAGLSCAVSVKRHLREPRSRVLISNAYEQKIETMDERLKSMEKVLTKLAESAALSQTQPCSSSTASIHVDSHSMESTPFAQSQLPSSELLFKTQTINAQAFLERTVIPGQVRHANPVVQLAIVNLRGLVEQESHRPSREYDIQPSFTDSAQTGPALLAIEHIASAAPLLEFAMSAESSIFRYAMMYPSINDFPSVFQRGCEAPDTQSLAEKVILNAGLYYLFIEQEYNDAIGTTQLKAYNHAAALCQHNLETAMRDFPSPLLPDVRNVQALLLLASYAIDQCWPLAAWRLNCMAATLYKGGLIPASNSVGGDAPLSHSGSNLFWQVSTLDKCLSLRLGCDSILEDVRLNFDVPATPDFGGSRSRYLEEVALPRIRITTASLRARVYSQIYSPEALSGSPEEHSNKAVALANECQTLEADIIEIQERADCLMEDSSSFRLANLLFMSSIAQFYALATLVHRVIPPQDGSWALRSSISEKSLESARHSVDHHLTCMKMLGSGQYLRRVYVHWTLMLTPFAPAFVLFCHALEAMDQSSLQMLRFFTNSLRQLTGATEVAGRMFLLCQGMCDVLEACLDDSSWSKERAGLDDVFATLNQTGLEFISNELGGSAPLESVDFYFGNITLPE
ncbi:hypothetical protein CC79DRAFT_675915 [Sarocladium strictum]